MFITALLIKVGTQMSTLRSMDKQKVPYPYVLECARETADRIYIDIDVYVSERFDRKWLT